MSVFLNFPILLKQYERLQDYDTRKTANFLVQMIHQLILVVSYWKIMYLMFSVLDWNGKVWVKHCQYGDQYRYDSFSSKFQLIYSCETNKFHLLWAHKTGTGGSRIRPTGLGGPWNWPWATANNNAPNMTFCSMFMQSEMKLLQLSHL